MRTIVFGVDLAKNVFSVCEQDSAGHVLRRQYFKRDAFALRLAQVPVGSLLAMEACSGAYHKARRCLEFGLQPRIMEAQFATPFHKGRKAKNDRADAEAVTTAARLDHPGENLTNWMDVQTVFRLIPKHRKVR